MSALFHCGAVEIKAVTEFLGAAFSPARLFPEMPPETIEQHLGWIAPEHYCLARRRLIMGTHSWVIRTAHHVVIVDTCVGNHKSRPANPGFDALNGPWLERLARAGVDPDEVDFICCTHLHADHVGWNTRWVNGRWVPTFPRAKVICSRTELRLAEQAASSNLPGTDDRALWQDSVLPVLEAGLLTPADGVFEIQDGLLLVPAPGHTHGNAVVWLASGGHSALFSGDVCHHPLQVFHPELNSCFCIDPLQARETRKHLLASCAEQHARIMPAHWAGALAGEIVERPSGFGVAWR